MNLTARLSRFVESESAPLQEATLGYSAATLSTIDSDEHLFRRLTQTTRDLPSITMERQREIAFLLGDVNPVGKRIINMVCDFVVGDGSEWGVRAKNDKVAELLNKHWDDPQNAYVERLTPRVRELGLAGEQCYSAKTGTDGIVRLGYVDPGFIQSVTFLEHDMESYDVVRLKKHQTEQEEKRLKVVNYDQALRRMVGKMEGDTEFADSCFYWAINKPINATRGRSDLLPLADTLDLNDRFHFNRLENRVLQNAFFRHWKITGATRKELLEFAKENARPPKPGSQRFTNEKVEVQDVSPNLQASDAAEEMKIIRSPLATGSGLPVHWLFGEGENANRASAYEMSDPPMRMIRTRQLFVKRMYMRVFRYQIDEAREHGLLASVKEDELYDFSLDVPEISSRDMAKASNSLVQVVTAVSLAIDAELISRETGLALVAFAASQLGLEVNPEEEIEKIDAAIGEDFPAMGGDDDEEEDAPVVKDEEEPEGAMA